MHKTTLNLPKIVWLRLRNLAAREGRSVSDVAGELLGEALEARTAGPFASHAAGDADVDDLAENAEKYLREGLS